jgi:hypothetical protein
MKTLQYLSKRDENNSFIRFKAPIVKYEISNFMFSELSKSKFYKILKEYLPEEYTELYFKKKFNLELDHLSSKIVINEWNFNNDKDNYFKEIITDDYPYFKILKSYLALKNIKIKKKINIQYLKKKINSKKYAVFFFICKIKNFFTNIFYKKKLGNNGANIGVNFVEGFDFNKRNDLFFLSKKIKNSSVIYYCENKKRIYNDLNNKKEVNNLFNSGIKFIKLWQWHNIEKVNFLENLKKFFSIDNKFDKWILAEINNLILRVNFWYCFFKDHQIKINLNSEEFGLSNVVKQIALKKLDGCSIGKCRSNPMKVKGQWLGFYPNDIFFVWGKDSAFGINKTINYIKNIIITGYPYKESHENEEHALRLRKIFSDNGVKFTILLLDGSYSDNKNSHVQLFPSKQMSNFIGSFLKWVIQDKDIGLIIKSKKKNYLSGLNEINNLLVEAKKTKRLHIIDDLGKEAKTYSKIVNFTVGTSVDVPTAVIQMAIFGSKSIIYDFANYKNYENDLYHWGENKIIFNKLDLLIKNLKNFKEGKNINNDLGDWSKQIYNYDIFCDNRGSERIEEYIFNLKKCFEKGYSSNDSIDYANNVYIKNWGEDKIFKINK